MADEPRVILDQLTDKHELLPFDPTDPDATQVVAVEHGGRTLEVIVPLLYDGTRIGEVVTAAVTGETVFLLCRHDRPLDDDHGTLGLLVVAVPDREGRYRAVIAHATHALEQGTDERQGLGLYPTIRPGTVAGPPTGATGPGRERPTGLDAIRALDRARPFRRFVIETTAGERFSVPQPGSIAISPGGDAMIQWSGPGRFTSIDPADISEVTRDDPESIAPAPRAEARGEDRETLRADLRRLRGRIDGVEADIQRIALDFRNKIERVDLDLIRGLARLNLWSGIQGCLLGFLLVVLFFGPGPTFYWTGAIDAQVRIHDRRLDLIEANSTRRHEAIGLRLDELRAAIGQANDRSPPPR
jgi:hypothetical protein